jgi:nicotinamidase-related amidase
VSPLLHIDSGPDITREVASNPDILGPGADAEALLRDEGCGAQVIESLTADGRDRSLDYKISGFHVPKGSWDAQVLEAVAPTADEMVLPKTSSSAFMSTALDMVLRNLGIKHLMICGGLTDQCVESAVRDACDLGYLVSSRSTPSIKRRFLSPRERTSGSQDRPPTMVNAPNPNRAIRNFQVTLVPDACVTHSEERHVNSLLAVRGYCRQRTTTVLVAEIEAGAASPSAVRPNPGVTIPSSNRNSGLLHAAAVRD